MGRRCRIPVRLVFFKLRVVFTAADERRAKLNFAHRYANIMLRTGHVDAFRVGKGSPFQRIDKMLGFSALLAAG